MFKKVVLYFILIILSNTAIAQSNTLDYQINWKTPKHIIYQDISYIIPDFENAELSEGLPHFYKNVKLKNKNYKVKVKSYRTVESSNEDLLFFKQMKKNVSEELSCEMNITDAKKEHYFVFQLFPFVKENGVLKRISSISFELSPEIVVQNDVLKDFASNSVLASGSGQWVKINVKNDAIYKIDKAFLESCGINTNGLNPQHINIYGNGDGKLPEKNNVPYTDDLAKNAIFIQGESDGVFDDGDYILFYGWGPHRWYPKNSYFAQDKHIYSEVSSYFINVNSNDTPLRITDLIENPLTETKTVSTYNYYANQEQDLVSLVKGGQRWYGELFDTELEQTFNFSIPNITSDSVLIRVAIASNSKTSAGTLQKYLANNTSLYSETLPSAATDYARDENGFWWKSPTSTLNFKIQVTRNNPSTMTYLDNILLNARRTLLFNASQFNFTDLKSVGVGEISKFVVNNFPSNGFIWDVTDRHQPKKIQGVLSGSTFEFKQATDSLRYFVGSNGLNFQIPEYAGQISYQNIHALPQAHLVIVTHKNFIAQAERLADLHRSEGLDVNVVTSELVYNEFSSGMVDATAIRKFAKMFYDRGIVGGVEFKNLLLFGDGTYDPKNRVPNNNYFIPTYQMSTSEDHIGAMVTDDYFGLLSDNDGIYALDMMDIGVGRLLISDLTQAKQQVDKIEHYMKNGSNLFVNSTSACCGNASTNTKTFGDWRLNYVQVADDEENGYFVKNDTEPQCDTVEKYYHEMNVDKLYTDAYTQITTAGGQRYPDVFDAITNKINRGVLLFNYVGHGGEVGLAEERIVTIPQIESWNNINQLNLFVSATCEFTKYDDPSRVSAGELVALNPTGGAIALMTTSRSVFFGVNTITGLRFYQNVFKRDANNQPLDFGEIMRVTKNGSGSSDNKRSFTLIGDPALKIAMPLMNIVTDSINGKSPTIIQDTLMGLSKVTIKGHIEDFLGNPITDFNGILTPTIFDKKKLRNTLAQDPNSPVINFTSQKNIVYKGKATVTNGQFVFQFVVPKDIDLAIGQAKISYYAENGIYDAGGFDTLVKIGGMNPNGINDVVGPEVNLYLNDNSFVNGSLTDETPILIAEIFDENGINTVGNGIGHDITAIIDANTANQIVLNDYYVAETDSYQSGKVTYNMSPLAEGKHTLTFKIWDVNNNSSEQTIDFEVKNKEAIALSHVLNYPNPFTTSTQFFFEHNQVCSQLETQVQIMTISGRVVKSIQQTVNTNGFRVEGIPWDGKDEFGDQLAKGVYIYRISVKTPDGDVAEKIEKLFLLK